MRWPAIGASRCSADRRLSRQDSRRSETLPRITVIRAERSGNSERGHIS